MLTEYDTDEALATFRCGGIDPHLFLVSRWQGSEGVSRLYRFEVDLASADADIDLDSILGSRATLTLRTDAGDVLPWHGIVTELRQTRRDETYAYYRAVLEPQLALLRLFRQSRAYVHADPQFGGKPDLASVIRMVLEQAGLTQEGEPDADPVPHYAIRVPDSDIALTKSSFICQFEETSLDFLMRRLEHAGVYFWFEQGHDREIVVFGNSRDQQPGEAIDMVWRPDGDLNPEAGIVAVSRFDHTVSVQPKGVVLRDFSVSQPSLDLTVNADVNPGAQGASDRFDTLGNIELYGSHYNKQDQGETVATIRAEEIACQRNRYFGEARTGGLRAGYPVELDQHFRDSFNARYYVIVVEHEGRQSLPRQTAEQGDEGRFYHAHFTVLPEALQFRPARITRVPRIVGFLSAIVMAEGDGQYAQMNEYGCYRIRFLFAPPGTGGQDDANSAWVRMATPYAGSQHGMNFPLLKGTEVLVSFLGGDPDRPVIVAAIPNEENPSIRNQDNATQPGLRTAGQNALEFEDREGQEHARLSSPSGQTTIHLGTDPKNSAQSGIRMATTAHVGVTGTSYIHQVPSIFHMEIGTAGNVDVDPESRLAFKLAQEEQKARYLERLALKDGASEADQLKALEAKLTVRELALELLKLRLAAAKAADPRDEVYIKALQRDLEEAEKAHKKFKKSVDDVRKNKEKAKDVLHDNLSAEAAAEEAEKEKVINTYSYGVNNSMAFSLANSTVVGNSNSAFLGLNNSLTIGLAAAIQVAGNLGVTIAKSKSFVLDDKEEAAPTFILKSARERKRTLERETKALSDRLEANTKYQNIKTNYHVDVGGSYTIEGFGFSKLKLIRGSSELVVEGGRIKSDAYTVQIGAPANGMCVEKDSGKVIVKATAKCDIVSQGPVEIKGTGNVNVNAGPGLIRIG